MAEKKGVGSKLLGIFVESDGDSGPDAKADAGKTPAEIVAELAGQPAGRKGGDGGPPPNLKLDKLAASGAAPAQGGTAPDFDALFRDAGMDGAELDRVKKAEELLKGLPEGTPQPVKKQIVEASLKAFGFEVEKIVGAAQNQKKALDAYVKVNETATAKAITDAEAQIRSFNEKIASLRGEIEKRTAGLTTLSQAAQRRKGDVQKVLDFFQMPTPPAS